MNSRPIHQNLDTSFVNLSALVKYLRKRQFVGSVRIQLNGYQADIHLKEDNQISVREHDQISGRISDGKEAFQRLLIRAREPGGTVNVYQLVKSPPPHQPKNKQPAKAAAKPSVRTEVVQAEIMEIPVPKPSLLPFEADINANGVRNGNGYSNGHSVNRTATAPASSKVETPVPVPAAPEPDRQTSLPDFPFDLTNKVERKAQNRRLATEDWQTLLQLTVELLGVVDKTLAKHRLDFSAAFRKARAEIAEDYPFMNPSARVFDYRKGRIKMNKQVNETVFVNSVAESLGRIVERLGQNPKFATLYRDTNHLIIALINKRKRDYDRFEMTRPLERILGL